MVIYSNNPHCQDKNVIDLGVIRKGSVSGVCLPKMKSQFVTKFKSLCRRRMETRTSKQDSRFLSSLVKIHAAVVDNSKA